MSVRGRKIKSVICSLRFWGSRTFPRFYSQFLLTSSYLSCVGLIRVLFENNNTTYGRYDPSMSLWMSFVSSLLFVSLVLGGSLPDRKNEIRICVGVESWSENLNRLKRIRVRRLVISESYSVSSFTAQLVFCMSVPFTKHPFLEFKSWSIACFEWGNISKTAWLCEMVFPSRNKSAFPLLPTFTLLCLKNLPHHISALQSDLFVSLEMLCRSPFLFLHSKKKKFEILSWVSRNQKVQRMIFGGGRLESVYQPLREETYIISGGYPGIELLERSEIYFTTTNTPYIPIHTHTDSRRTHIQTKDELFIIKNNKRPSTRHDTRHTHDPFIFSSQQIFRPDSSTLTTKTHRTTLICLSKRIDLGYTQSPWHWFQDHLVWFWSIRSHPPRTPRISHDPVFNTIITDTPSHNTYFMIDQGEQLVLREYTSSVGLELTCCVDSRTNRTSSVDFAFHLVYSTDTTVISDVVSVSSSCVGCVGCVGLWRSLPQVRSRLSMPRNCVWE